MIYLMISIGILVGLIMVLGIPIVEFAGGIVEAIRPKNKSLKTRVIIITGNKKRNFIVRNFSEAKEILELTGRSNQYGILCRISILMALAGGFISIVIGNLLLLPILSVGFALIPLLYVKFSVGAYKKHLNGELETALSVITTSYIRCGDLGKAVKENIDQLKPPISSVFKRFIAEISFVNANIPAAVLHMKGSISSTIFDEWCDTLIDCQRDRSLSPTLLNSVDKFSDLRNVQAEFDTEIYAPLKEFITMALLALANLPLMFFINRSWFHTLTHHVAGQLVLAITVAIIFAGITKVVAVCKPVEWNG